ncbi:MAG TPA: hypothetical protein VD931_07405 [Baekduia sp.]|nr:hypothetical protein [Baekduia sp.]
MAQDELPAFIRTAPRAVGVITLLIGAGLALAPEKAGPVAALEPAEARAFGIADLALVPGLLLGSDKARWMRARAALNVAMAGYYAAVVGRRRPDVAKSAAGALAALTVADSTVARALRRAG